MRNVTPKVTPPKKSGKTDETPDRKLKQARLPFKILPPGKAATGGDGDGKALAKSTPGKEGVAQKRKFVEEVESDDSSAAHTDDNKTTTAANSPDSKENALKLTSKKKKKLEETAADAVIVLDDDEEVAEEQNAKAKEESNATTRQTRNSINNNKNKKIPAGKSAIASPKTPLAGGAVGKRRKGAGTPLSAGGSASKVQIKIPFGGGGGGGAKSSSSSKTKKAIRRKSTLKADDDTKRSDSLAESSDDIEIIADELNPQKRQRVEAAESKPEEAHDEGKVDQKNEGGKGEALPADTTVDSVSLSASEEDSNDDVDKDGSSSPADETDAPTPTAASSAAPKRGGVAKSSASTAAGDRKKNLTPKQMKLMEQRRKLRDEKERKLVEERQQKQREKEEKELAKKRDREEKEEVKRREREEKDEQRRKEREEKERKRLAEVEAKRKKTEAKEEELRKKEEERKRKEHEKEEAAMKKKKVAESFKKWFRPSGTDHDQSFKKCSEDDAVDVDSLAFRPFQVRGDMTLAPIRRRVLSSDSREQLEALLTPTGSGREATTATAAYLDELRSGKVVARKWRRQSIDAKSDQSDDVQIVEDELAGAGQAIVEEAPAPVERVRAKFYKFHENRRPAYYGTWRKKTNLVKARRPFAQDKKHFDYEVDSDLEWEEEEPGESLDGSDDDKEKESEDDDYEVDNEWFVPHGHLSDEELQNEDEFGMGGDNDREAQKAKLKILQQEFAQEMKKKTEKIKPRLIGCLWVDENGNQPELCPKIIWDSLNTRAAMFTEPPLLDEPEQPERPELAESSRSRPIGLTEPMQRDLVRLVHGNVHSKIFLIKEFIATVEAKEGDAISPPLKSTVREKIEEFAEWKVLDLESGQPAASGDSSRKRKAKKRLCWVVADDVLKRMDLQTQLTLDNTWQYTLQPKLTKESAPETTAPNPSAVQSPAVEPPTAAAETSQQVTRKSLQNTDTAAAKSKRSLNITKFTKVLGEDEPREKAAATRSSEATQPSATSQAAPPPAKKRVPLLMSVGRGEKISQPIKNALISQFLKNNATPPSSAKQGDASNDDKVIELD